MRWQQVLYLGLFLGTTRAYGEVSHPMDSIHPLIAMVEEGFATHTSWRDYSVTVTPDEKKDIKYIVTTLGNGSLVKIARSRSALKKAGKRINHIHPLQFLYTVSSDSEMRSAMKAMDGRTWVWGEFVDGLKKSLDCEASHNNMRQEFIDDFAHRLGISVDKIQNSVHQRKWNQLINILISSF